MCWGGGADGDEEREGEVEEGREGGNYTYTYMYTTPAYSVVPSLYLYLNFFSLPFLSHYLLKHATRTLTVELIFRGVGREVRGGANEPPF